MIYIVYYFTGDGFMGLKSSSNIKLNKRTVKNKNIDIIQKEPMVKEYKDISKAISEITNLAISYLNSIDSAYDPYRESVLDFKDILLEKSSEDRNNLLDNGVEFEQLIKSDFLNDFKGTKEKHQIGRYSLLIDYSEDNAWPALNVELQDDKGKFFKTTFKLSSYPIFDYSENVWNDEPQRKLYFLVLYSILTYGKQKYKGLFDIINESK